MNKMKILIADDHPLIRQAIRSVIESFSMADEILEADDGRQTLELSRQHQIDLFILDYRMPEIRGYDTAKTLLNCNPKSKIIIITAYTESILISNLFNLGVRGFISKNTDVEEIRLAIHEVLLGKIYLNKVLEERMLREKNYCNQNSSPLSFTKRECDVITLLTKGKTSKDISQLLELSPKTIETYRCRLLEKVGVKNTAELVDYIHCNGLM